MRNIIFAALTLAAPSLALAQDPASRMEAVGACPECEVSQAASSPTQLQRISADVMPTVSRGLAAAGSDHSLRIGRVETHNEIQDETGAVGIGEGNGVIISPCYMITNHHGVYGNSKDVSYSANHSIEFFFGQGQDSFRWKTSGQPIKQGVRTSSGGGDWALVRLNKCPGKKVGWPELDLRTPDQLRTAALTMVGVPAGRSTGEVSVQNCNANGKEVATGGLRHTCRTSDGLSAAALFTAGDRLAAINVGTVGGVPFGVTMAEIFADPQARALIEADKAQFAMAQSSGPVTAALTSGRAASL